MNERERVLALLAGEKPDQVPWLGDLTYWTPWAFDHGALDARYRGEGTYQMHRDLGVGYYLQGYFPFSYHYDHVEIRTQRRGNETCYTFETPVGSVREVHVALPESYTEAIREHSVKTIEDMKVLCYIQAHTRYEPDYAEAERRISRVRDNGIVLCYLPKSPFMELVAYKAGIMAIVELLEEDEAAFESLLAEMREHADRAARVALDSPAECLMLPENISSEVVGKAYFERYMRDWHESWYARIARAGKHSFVHLDGTMRGLIRELSGAGARVIEALTPAPVGDIALEELHTWVGDHTILWGGLPGVYFTDLVSDRQFDEYVVRALSVMRRAPRYVLGVADQVPPGCRWERIARVRALVDAHGRYD